MYIYIYVIGHINFYICLCTYIYTYIYLDVSSFLWLCVHIRIFLGQLNSNTWSQVWVFSEDLLIQYVVYCDDINNNTNNRSGLCHSWYERVYFFLSLDLINTRRETKIIWDNTNHTMLTPPTIRGASCRVKDLNSFCWSRPKLISSGQIRKIQPPASTVEPQLSSFQNPKILRTISSGYDVIHTLNGTSCPIDCHILSARACECIVWLRHLNQETLRSSKPYQTK